MRHGYVAENIDGGGTCGFSRHAPPVVNRVISVGGRRVRADKWQLRRDDARLLDRSGSRDQPLSGVHRRGANVGARNTVPNWHERDIVVGASHASHGTTSSALLHPTVLRPPSGKFRRVISAGAPNAGGGGAIGRLMEGEGSTVPRSSGSSVGCSVGALWLCRQVTERDSCAIRELASWQSWQGTFTALHCAYRSASAHAL